MNPTFSTSSQDITGRLVIFEGPDGCGKTTQAIRLKNHMKALGKKVRVSHWKNAKYFRDFFEEQYKGSRKQMVDPTANLILQAADLIYRLEKKIIPALKKGSLVVMDRGLETIYARGYSIGLTHDQIRYGILWPIEHLYKDIFDQAVTVYFKSDTTTTMERMQERMDPNKHELAEGTLIDLHMVRNLTYSEEGHKMTLAKKRTLVKRIQRNMIRQYDDIIQSSVGTITVNANLDRAGVAQQIMTGLGLQ